MFYLMTCEKQISYRPAAVEVYDRRRNITDHGLPMIDSARRYNWRTPCRPFRA
jgi:hypothetical protein